MNVKTAERSKSRKPPQQYYYLSLLGFLLLLWGATLLWFHFELQMHFSHLAVGISMALFAATIPVVSWLIPFNTLQQHQRQCQLVWFSLLAWLLLLNSLLLYHTGGTINPLIYLLLAPLVLGMLILSTSWFMSLALLASACYLSLGFFYVPIMSLKVQSLPAFFAWYLHGSMLAFILLVMLLALLIFPLRKRLEAQRSALSQQQNRALQNEYLLSVASLASASVHQLSTPLNTLSLLQDLLKNEITSDQGKAYLQTANQQLSVCINALHSLRNKAEEVSQPANAGIEIGALLKDLRQEFALLHPQSELQTSTDIASGLLYVDAAFKLAIMNLLDNAARYSPDFIRLKVSKHAGGWTLRVEDQGGGLVQNDLETLGQGLMEEYHGTGMGVFLSRMIIERFGGSLNFRNGEIEGQPGLIAEVSLPISEPHDKA
ncbi:sensor histidine kinase KdpD [Thiomicrorhabdus sp. 6S3-12]|uniref:sensor histidine kinase n=1 Tax=Thiomicrorhabdus sp. 6S3-12 TaxID=2819681 RepID=UPI001AAD6B52|nr:HAMP domain-containing sensor histidine kinase [Thiomicrorhabdus sp. 6S3-12]MBO1923354.1 HAMP domain-containing histidine kinase [Thiomicrorhabdus sp. 6S3-12]